MTKFQSALDRFDNDRNTPNEAALRDMIAALHDELTALLALHSALVRGVHDAAARCQDHADLRDHLYDLTTVESPR